MLSCILLLPIASSFNKGGKKGHPKTDALTLQLEETKIGLELVAHSYTSEGSSETILCRRLILCGKI